MLRKVLEMILSKFRSKKIKKYIDKALISSNKPSLSFSDKKINSILVFVDENTINNSVQIIAKELNIDISKIETIIYIKKRMKEENSENVLTENDFNWLGKIKRKYIQNLVNLKFDLLINLTANNLLLDYLVALSKAKFKVGFSNADKRLYDFMIDTNKVSVFSVELKKYLQILNKL